MFSADTEGVSAPSGLDGSQPEVDQADSARKRAVSLGRRMANYTILLIDYEPRSIERFREPLTGAGYVVEVATDGLSGIEAFHRLNPDMVLVEAMIPKKHGFEVCQELKRSSHGRRTPVLITTGVYKGRKYRTQALHIYGCDEYIEKPIAPEQLLAVVAKFFTGPPHALSSDSHAASPAVGSATAPAEVERTSAPSSSPKVTSPETRGSGSKSTPTPKAVVTDLTEEEIMARLDAILPGGEPSWVESASAVEASPLATTAVESLAPDILELRGPDASDATPESDPFVQMQAELSAELGSLATALDLEPAPVLEAHAEPESVTIHSDHEAPPSLLETLPIPLASPAEAPPLPESHEAGQVVSFDAKRSRKNKKRAKAELEKRTTGPHAVSPDRAPQRTRESGQGAQSPATRSHEISLPPGSLAATEIDPRTARPGVPAWAWALVALVALVAVYFVFLRDGTERAGANPPVPQRAMIATSIPAEAESSETAPSAPAAEPSHANLVLNSVNVPTSRAPNSGAVVAPSSGAADPAPAGTKPAQPKIETRPPGTSVSSPGAAIRSWTPAPVAPPAMAPYAPVSAIESPVGVEQSVTDVEAIAEAAITPPSAPTVAPGTLLSIEEVDTAPVSLSRKVPAYSMLARQMRLQGTVVLNVLVNENGTVDDVVIVKGISGADLNDATVKAAKAWTYRPATKDGVAVKVWKTEQVAFKL